MPRRGVSDVSAKLLIVAVCALLVLVRALCIVARTSREGWPRWQHLGFTASASALAAGAVASLFSMSWAGLALLVGLAGVIVFDRR
jgi:hypothetical protein